MSIWELVAGAFDFTQVLLFSALGVMIGGALQETGGRGVVNGVGLVLALSAWFTIL